MKYQSTKMHKKKFTVKLFSSIVQAKKKYSREVDRNFKCRLPLHPERIPPDSKRWQRLLLVVLAELLAASAAIPAELILLAAVWLLQIILAAVLEAPLLECQGFLDENLLSFSLTLLFCILAERL